MADFDTIASQSRFDIIPNMTTDMLLSSREISVSTAFSKMSGQGIRKFISEIKSKNQESRNLVVGVHIDYDRSKNSPKCHHRFIGLLTLCVGERCIAIPVESIQQYQDWHIDFLNDPGIYFMGKDIHAGLSKIQLECRNAVDVGTLCAATYKWPLLAELNIMDLAWKVLGLNERTEKVYDWSNFTNETLTCATKYASAAFLVGERLMSCDKYISIS